MINPTIIFQMKSMWERFERNHPKFPRFLSVVGRECLQAGTVLEISVTKPDGENITSNIRLTEDDMELFAAIRDLATKA